MREASIKGGRCSKLAAMFCQDPVFRAWLDVNRAQPIGTTTEDDAKLFFYRACKVETRARIDHDRYAMQMFHKIRNQFLSDQREVEIFRQANYEVWRCPGYLQWVKSLPSAISGAPADDPHHLIGHGMGGMGTKVSDLLTFPLTRVEHSALHDGGYKSWESRHGSQWMHVVKTIERAVFEGVLVFEG